MDFLNNNVFKDHKNCHKNQNLMSLLTEKDEQIIFSCEVIKLNKWGWK